MLGTTKVRVDTTVVPANVAYPTDSGLLPTRSTGSPRLAGESRLAGGGVSTKIRDRSRAVGRRAHDPNAKQRTRNAAAKDEARAIGTRKNAEFAGLADLAANEAERLRRNAIRAIRGARRLPVNDSRRPARPCRRAATGRLVRSGTTSPSSYQWSYRARRPAGSPGGLGNS